jgi:hypothetical protein
MWRIDALCMLAAGFACCLPPAGAQAACEEGAARRVFDNLAQAERVARTSG